MNIRYGAEIRIICNACGINGSIIITIVQKRIYTRENGNKESELWIS